MAPSVQKPESSVRATLERLVETGLRNRTEPRRGRTYAPSAAIYRKAGKKSEYVRRGGFCAYTARTDGAETTFDKHGGVKRADAADLLTE
jgi:ATP-dependent DNA helicase RecG